MTIKQKLSRRVFLERSARLGAIGMVAPRILTGRALGQEAKVAPGDRIRVGLIGCGGMGRGKQPSCSPDYHCRIDVLSLLSLRLGRSIRFDPETETESIVGDPEAAKLAVPTYRAPWKFPSEYLKG